MTGSTICYLTWCPAFRVANEPGIQTPTANVKSLFMPEIVRGPSRN